MKGLISGMWWLSASLLFMACTPEPRRGRSPDSGTPASGTTVGTAPSETWNETTSECQRIEVPSEPCVGGHLDDTGSECERDTDCPDFGFCVGGTCYARDKLITICLEEMSLDGPLPIEGKPRLVVEWGGPMHFSILQHTAPIQHDTCAPKWHACTQWPATALNSSHISATLDAPNQPIVDPWAASVTLDVSPRSKLVGQCKTFELEANPNTATGVIVVSAEIF